MRDRSKSRWSAVPLAALALASYLYLAGRLGPGFAIPVGIVGLVCAAVITLAVTRRRVEPLQPPDEITGQVLDELEQLRGRLQELEERVDFSERLLAQRAQEPSPEQSRL